VPGLIAAGLLAGGRVLGAVLGWLPGIAVALVAVAAVVFLVPVRAQRAHDCGSAAGSACACRGASAQAGSGERSTLTP
jgi:hypothetical protein